MAIPRKFALTRKEPGSRQLVLNLSGKQLLTSRVGKSLLLFVEFSAGVVLAIALAIAILAWRVSSGDVAVNFLAAPIENAVNGQLNEYTIHIGGAILQQSEAGSGVSFRLRDITLVDKLGFTVADAPKAAIGINPLMLLVGRVSPTFIDLIGPELVMVYRHDGHLVMDTEKDLLTGPANEIRETDSLAASNSDRGLVAVDDSNQVDSPSVVDGVKSLLGLRDGVSSPFDTLSRIGIRDANLVFIHERLALRWELKHGNLDLRREEGGVAYEIQVKLAGNQEARSLKISGLVRGLDDGLMITSFVDQFVPRRSANQIEGLGGLAALDMPISAKFGLKLSSDGTVIHADMNAMFSAGFIRLAEGDDAEGILIDEANLALKYDARDQRIFVERSSFYSGQNFAIFEGSIVATTQGGRNYWRYELNTSDAKLSSADIHESAIAIDNASFSGRYEPFSRNFWLDSGKIESEAASFTVSGRVRAGEFSPEIDAVLNLSPLSINALKQIWPSFLATGARDWVVENIISGSITDGIIEARLPAGLIDRLNKGAVIPEDALKISFGFENAVVRYFRPLPLLRSLNGRGEMRGGHFSLDGTDGQIVVGSGGRVERVSGRVEIPVTTAETPIAYIRVVGGGSSDAVLELLDYEPLGYAREIGLTPSDVAGLTNIELDLSVPLLRDVMFEDVNIAAEAIAENVTARAFFGGRDITDGTLKIEVLPTRVEVTGEVKVAEIPVAVEWSRPFGSRRTTSGQLTMRARLDRDDRKRIGLDFGAVVGPVTLEVQPLEGEAEETVFDVKMDLAEAQISIDSMGWTKPAGQSSNSSFRLVQQKSGDLNLQNFRFTGAHAVMTGEMTLDEAGNLKMATLPVFKLGRDDDINLTISRNGRGEMDVLVVGRSFDASPLIRQYFSLVPEKSTNSADLHINIDASIARVRGLSNDVMTDAKIILSVYDGLIERMSLNGQIAGSSVVTTVAPTDRGQGRKLDINARDAGAAFRYVGLYSRISGGKLTVTANLPRDPFAPMKGNLLVEKFSVASNSVIREIAEASAVTSIQEIESRGIYFDRMHMPFERVDGVVYLRESYLRGPSLGATLSGAVDFGGDKINISGTYVPLYAVNNLLSHVPVFGQILTGGRNEGVVGITFSVVGPTSNPSVLVNPISAMAPGVFRKLFNFPTAGTPVVRSPTTNAESDR